MHAEDIKQNHPSPDSAISCSFSSIDMSGNGRFFPSRPVESLLERIES